MDHGLPDICLSPETLLLHGGTIRSNFDETNPAIYANSGYVYKKAEDAEAGFANPGSRFVYSRSSNPNAAMLEKRLAAFEGADRCFVTASGMASVFAAVAGYVNSGDRVVATHQMFNSCLFIFTDILPRFGIETVLVNGSDMQAWTAALATPAKLVFFETPANPTMDMIDIRLVSDLAHEAGAIVVVDNVFATPVLQKPLQLGADVVVYSATKHIDGQGRCNGGAILCSETFAGIIAPFLRHTGPMLSQFNAWVLFHGLETLDIRIRAQSESASRIAAYLADEPAVHTLRYPFHPSHPQYELAKRQMSLGGNLISFNMAGGKAAAFAMMNALQIILISNNLGDTKSLISHPRTTTHQRLSDEECARSGIQAGTVRLSIGLENIDDLLCDLTQSIAAIGFPTDAVSGG